jgi:hypothetical protein
VSGLRSLVEEALAEEGLLLAEDRRDRVQREAMELGRRSLPHILLSTSVGSGDEQTTGAGSLGLADAVLPRIFGLGVQQARGLAAIAGTPRVAEREVGRLGGLLNLGVALFDHVCDELPERAELLLAQVTPDALDAGLAGTVDTQLAGAADAQLAGTADARLAESEGSAAPACGDAGVDLLMAVIADFFRGARKLGGTARDRKRVGHLIRSMYGGERLVTETGREESGATQEVWWALRRKSVLPMETMAALALLAHPNADIEQRSRARVAAALAGEAIWIVDDLADMVEDWGAGCWSRALWLLAHAPGEVPADGEEAIRRLLDTGVAAAEARRLTERLSGLRALPGASERTFLRPIQAAVAAWVDLVPD